MPKIDLSKFSKVGSFIKKNHSNNKIDINYECNPKLLTDNRGRIYLIVEKDNNETKILKIGHSNDKGGIKGTISWYINALSQSAPGRNRFIIHLLIAEKLASNKQIEIYVKFLDSILYPIEGFFQNNKFLEIPVDCTYIETQYIEDYSSIFGHPPEWNYQEKGTEKIPEYLNECYVEYLEKQKSNKKENYK